MNIRIEETNGKKKYWVNDVPYDRIEDIPAEYQKHFIDKDNNGMPDQFDGLLGMKEGLFKDFLNSSKEEVLNMSKDKTPRSKSSSKTSTKTSTPIDDYTSSVEERSIMPTVIKIGVAILIILVGIWLYPQLVKSDPGEVQVEGEQVEGEPAPVSVESFGRLRLVIDDPNEPPYQMIGVVYEADSKLFSFNLPGGAITESSDSTMQIAMTRQEGTNLNEATFSLLIREGVCTMREDEFNTGDVQIGDITFKKAELEDSDEGHSDHTYRYSLEKYGRCFHFRMALHSANPNTYDPPVEVFDEKAMIATMENVLASVKSF